MPILQDLNETPTPSIILPPKPKYPPPHPPMSKKPRAKRSRDPSYRKFPWKPTGLLAEILISNQNLTTLPSQASPLPDLNFSLEEVPGTIPSVTLPPKKRKELQKIGKGKIILKYELKDEDSDSDSWKPVPISFSPSFHATLAKRASSSTSPPSFEGPPSTSSTQGAAEPQSPVDK